MMNDITTKKVAKMATKIALAIDATLLDVDPILCGHVKNDKINIFINAWNRDPYVTIKVNNLRFMVYDDADFESVLDYIVAHNN